MGLHCGRVKMVTHQVQSRIAFIQDYTPGDQYRRNVYEPIQYYSPGPWICMIVEGRWYAANLYKHKAGWCFYAKTPMELI